MAIHWPLERSYRLLVTGHTEKEGGRERRVTCGRYLIYFVDIVAIVRFYCFESCLHYSYASTIQKIHISKSARILNAFAHILYSLSLCLLMNMKSFGVKKNIFVFSYIENRNFDGMIWLRVCSPVNCVTLLIFTANGKC